MFNAKMAVFCISKLRGHVQMAGWCKLCAQPNQRCSVLNQNKMNALNSGKSALSILCTWDILNVELSVIEDGVAINANPCYNGGQKLWIDNRHSYCMCNATQKYQNGGAWSGDFCDIRCPVGAEFRRHWRNVCRTDRPPVPKCNERSTDKIERRPNMRKHSSYQRNVHSRCLLKSAGRWKRRVPVYLIIMM